jgi:hypothetical protein
MVIQTIDKELDELERITRSMAMQRAAKRDAARKAYYERNKALGAQTASKSNAKDAPVAAPVGSPLKITTVAPSQTSTESSGNQKDILHSKTSSSNKVLKSSSSGWTAINRRK